MSEKQPYEKHLADKLRQIPPLEEVDSGWVQMRSLLDRDMPRGGGFGSSGGNGRWWIAGLIIVALTVGTWFTSEHLLSKNAANDPAVAATQNTAKPGPSPSTGVVLPVDSHKQPSVGNKPAAGNEETAANSKSVIPGKDHPPGFINAEANSETANNNSNKNTVIDNNTTLSSEREKGLTRNRNTGNSRNRGTKNNTGKSVRELPNVRGTGGETGTADNNSHPVSTISRDNTAHASGVNGNISYTGLQSIDPADVVDPYSAADLAAGMPKKNSSSAKSRSARAARNSEEKTFAFGLSLPLAFPLGDQKALGYNSVAGANTVSDYIPAPHFQYHFNSKTFVQTELQVMSPQFIRPLLLYQNKREIQPSTWQYNSVYARKLYYFNMPVSIYHSPFKHFYLGTGLQLSSMLSGVALYEERRGDAFSPNYTVSQKYTRFSNDSLSGRLNSTEVRLLLEFNYNRSRFTVGLRYNQAFNNYANFQVNNTTGFTYDKNKALQFYLRYNIWQDSKRKLPGKPLLTLK